MPVGRLEASPGQCKSKPGELRGKLVGGCEGAAAGRQLHFKGRNTSCETDDGPDAACRTLSFDRWPAAFFGRQTRLS